MTAPADEIPTAAIRVIAATGEHVAGMAGCHGACFPDQFTSRMGGAYARAFYRAYIDDPEGIAFVAREERTGKILGQVAGGRPGIRSDFLARASGRFFLRLAAKAVTDGVVRRALFNKLFGRRLSSQKREQRDDGAQPWLNENRPALLQVICLLPQGRGTGAAGGLMEAFAEACRSRGYEVMFLPVFISNERAIAFYRKHGWQLAQQTGDSMIMKRSV